MFKETVPIFLIEWALKQFDILKIVHYRLLSCLARDNWKKQYFEEKKKTLPLEEHALKLRREVDNLNRRVITRLEKEADAQQDHNQQLSVSTNKNLFTQYFKIKYSLLQFLERLKMHPYYMQIFKKLY